jgi:hypothetical protein
MPSIEYVVKMRESLMYFHQEVGRFVQSHGSMPIPGSKALGEQAESPRPQSIVSAWGMGTQLIEFGGDHLTAFVKTVTEPPEVIACWTCVRSMLESCALATWLFDPSIDSHERVGRVFALRYDGLDQQLKFARAAGKRATEIASEEDRVNHIEQEAIQLGYPPVRDRNQRRIGVAQQMPSATDMIGTMLDEALMYRLLSAVAHGHHWAIISLGFKPKGANEQIGGVAVEHFEKSGNLQGIALLGLTTMKALARPIWNQCHYFGWNALQLEEIYESVADRLQARNEGRFWRS